jgi:hypothetical protein
MKVMIQLFQICIVVPLMHYRILTETFDLLNNLLTFSICVYRTRVNYMHGNHSKINILLFIFDFSCIKL